MFIIGKLADIPSRSILEDLVSRNSSPDGISPCPYEGKEAWFYDRMKHYSVDVKTIIKSQGDFSALNARVIGDVPRPDDYCIQKSTGVIEKRLEHVHSSWVYAYLSMAVYGMEKNARNSIREAEKEIVELRIYQDDEDGTYRSEAELALEYVPIKGDIQIHYQDLMISILNRLHSQSKLRRVSLISAIIAYEKCKYNRKNKDANPSIGKVLQEGVLKMNTSGELTSWMRDNETFRDTFNWLTGINPYDPLYKDAMQLVNMCESLDIHLYNEDPYEYDEDFFKQLTVTYIKSNRDYRLTEKVIINGNNSRLLGQLNVSDYHLQDNIVVESRRIEDKIMTIVINFNFLLNKTFSIVPNREEQADDFIRYYGIFTKQQKQYECKQFITEDGFYKRHLSDIPEMFDLTFITKSPELNRAQAMLHYGGYLVLYLDSDDIFVLNVEDAIAYMTDHYNNTIRSGQSYSGQKVFGSWEKWS